MIIQTAIELNVWGIYLDMVQQNSPILRKLLLQSTTASEEVNGKEMRMCRYLAAISNIIAISLNWFVLKLWLLCICCITKGK